MVAPVPFTSQDVINDMRVLVDKYKNTAFYKSIIEAEARVAKALDK
jgi:hypothetical protein